MNRQKETFKSKQLLFMHMEFEYCAFQACSEKSLQNSNKKKASENFMRTFGGFECLRMFKLDGRKAQSAYP